METCTQEELREDSPILGTCRECFVKVPEGSRWSDAIYLKGCMERRQQPTQEFVPLGKKVVARPISSEPLNRMNPTHKFGVWMGVTKSNSAECFVETAEVVFGAREVRRIEHQDRWDKEAINNLIGVPWRNADGNWTVDTPVSRESRRKSIHELVARDQVGTDRTCLQGLLFRKL